MALTGTFNADFSSFQKAVDQSVAKLTEFESGANKVGNSLNRMVDRFSGRKVIQDATLAAEAVDRIGGVSKLTAGELQRIGVQANEAAAKLRAMGADVPQKIQNIADAANAASKSGSFLGTTFGQVFAGFTAAGLATTAIQRLAGGVMEFVEVGTRLPAIEQSFSRLAASMGQDGAVMLSQMSTATQGLVSDFNLMQSANKAMLLGLPVTSEAMASLAKTATVLGRAMGQDATTSLNDLITALGRSSPMILDNLGLTVKVGEANEAYAAKLGKAASELTDAEKKMAFYEAAMEAARKKTAELGEQTRTLGEIATSVWTQIGNSVSKSASDVNVALGKALSSVQDFAAFMAKVSSIGLAGAVLKTAAETRKAADELARLARMGKDVDLSLDDTAKGLQDFSAVLSKAQQQWMGLTEAQRKNILIGLELGQKAEDLAKAVGVSTEALKVGVDAEREYAQMAGKSATEIAKLEEASKKAGKAAQKAAEDNKKWQDAQHDAAVKAQEDWAKSRNAFMDAEAEKKAAAEATALALREQRLEVERLNATTFANFDDPMQARALLARPERSREDFIRMYAGYSGGLEFAEQQYQTEQEIRRRARRVVEADDARRAEENRRWSGGGAMGSGGSADVNIQVSGLLDPRTVDELSRQVGAAIVTRLGKVPIF